MGTSLLARSLHPPLFGSRASSTATRPCVCAMSAATPCFFSAHILLSPTTLSTCRTPLHLLPLGIFVLDGLRCFAPSTGAAAADGGCGVWASQPSPQWRAVLLPSSVCVVEALPERPLRTRVVCWGSWLRQPLAPDTLRTSTRAHPTLSPSSPLALAGLKARRWRRFGYLSRSHGDYRSAESETSVWISLCR